MIDPPAEGGLLRRRVAPAAGMALLLAGGALAVRVTAQMLLQETPHLVWVYTAAACVLAGVALVLIALPAIARIGDAVTAGDGTGDVPDAPVAAGPGAVHDTAAVGAPAA